MVTRLQAQVDFMRENESTLENEVKFLLEQLEKSKVVTEVSGSIKSMTLRHQQEVSRLFNDKETLENERRSFEIRLYERQSDCTRLKEEISTLR